jgi:predicted ribonuclease YlaK
MNGGAKMEIQIALNAEHTSLQEIKEQLETQAGVAGADVQLELREAKVKYRALDPTVLVAIVGAAGTGLGALITGLLQVGQQLAAKKIVLEAQGGQKLEVPASTPLDKIDHLLDRLSQMNEVKKISVQ